MSNRPARFLSLALASLFFAALLATPAQSFPVSPQQQAVTDVAVGQDDFSLAGVTFRPHQTESRFWPISDPTDSTPVQFFADGSAVTGAVLSPDAPADGACVPDHVAQTPQANAGICTGAVLAGGGGVNKVARIDQTGVTVRFPFPENLAAEDQYRLLGLRSKILGACDVGPIYNALPVAVPALGKAGIFMDIVVQKQGSGGAWADDRTIGTVQLLGDGYVWGAEASPPPQVPYSVQMYRGTASFGNMETAPLVQSGERLVAEYRTDLDGQCFLYYGSLNFCLACDNAVLIGPAEYSEMTLVTDSARLAVYTTDRDGRPTSGFPSADSIDASERRIVVEAIYASALGPGIMNQLTEYRHAHVRLKDLDTNEYLYYVDSTNGIVCDASPGPCDNFPQEFDTQRIRLVSGRADQLHPEPDVEQDLGRSVLRRSYVFAYNATQPDVKRLQAEFYSLSDGWVATSPIVAIGGKGITFSLLPGESLNHLVNPGETTQFSFVVKNVGTQADMVTVTVADPGGGWTATVLGGGRYFLPPGSFAVGQVEVTPPAGAGSGARSVVLRASSSFPDVEDPATFSLTTTVTSTVDHAVELASDLQSFAVKPGETKGFPITIANKGTGRDSFVVIPSIPANVQGYTVTVQPASLQLVAGGTQQLTVNIKAPAESPSITSWTIGLTAVAVGDSDVSSRIDRIVRIVPLQGLLADILDPGSPRLLRAQAEECTENILQDFNNENGFDFPACQAPQSTPLGSQGLGHIEVDQDFDDSAVFRITLHNQGDVEEQYRAEGVWDTTAAGTDDVNACDGDASNGVQDGIPDGWRFNWGEEVGSGVPAERQLGVGAQSRAGTGFSGRYQLNAASDPIVVPPHSSKDVYLELGHVFLGCEGGLIVGLPPEYWVAPDTPVSETYSEVAKFVVTFASLSDPAKLVSFPAQVNVVPEGAFLGNQRWSGGAYLPGVEAVNGTVGRTLLSSAATMDIHVINKGNEHDDLVIKVTGDSKWAHSLVVSASAPAGRACDLPTTVGNGQSMLCPDMGVYDEVRVSVVADPGPDVRVGDMDPITVTVSSGDAPGIQRTLNLVAQATGTFAFTTGPLGSTARTVAPGQPVSFPFFVANTGTSADSYRFSLLTGSNDWDPVLSSSAPVFVPSGFNVPAHLTVTAPAAAAAGATDVFKVQVESVGSGIKRTFEVSPTVQPPGGLLVGVKNGTDVLIPTRGVETPITVAAVPTAGAGSGNVVFTVDRQSLPPGWTVDRTEATGTLSSGSPPVSEAVFKVTAPADALGTARGILRVDAVTTGANALRGAADIGLNLASTFGLQLNATNGAKQVVAPGGPALFNLTLANLGLGADQVVFSSTAVPAGWQLLFSPAAVSLGPLEEAPVQVTVRAPVTAQPADLASVIVFATSTNDPSTIVSLPLTAQVGFNAIALEAVGPIAKGAPQETLVQVINVTNNGTLRDEIRLGALLDTIGLADHVDASVEPALVALNPNETVQVTLRQVLGPDVPGNNALQTSVVGRSLLDERPDPLRASATLPVQSRVLPYAALDINGDGLTEYAVDRNDVASDGFEQFRATLTPGGRPLATPDLLTFLRDDAREGLMEDVVLDNGTTVRLVVLRIDGDRDGKADLFVDGDADNQPDFYWDGDANQASRIEFRKDINGDQVPESFVDTRGGDGRLDAVYDLTRGQFTPVVQIDVDGDGSLDYVVDKNGDGEADQDETVLFTRNGALLIVQRVDVDGDGNADQVFDTDGDGNPDYFIPHGTTQSLAITMRDVNGDGVQDWTFDGDNDGRKESYYDPVTGQAHVIDAAGHFGDALKEYWYIGVLFAVVLVLFVALVLVTRR